MTHVHFHKPVVLVVIAAAVLSGFLSVVKDVQQASAVEERYRDVYRVSLPVTFKGFPRSPTQFGIEAESFSTSYLQSMARDTGAYWLRYTVLNWKLIEPVQATPAVYNWSAVNEGVLRTAYANGHHIIAKIQYTPEWAQKYPGVSCGPVAETSLDRYAQFVYEAVKRYSEPPFNIKYWELGNEPDVDRSLVPPDHLFGCWGEKTEVNYGGEYYAEMLKRVYPAIKSANPSARVLIGGLLLDCDPTHLPPGSEADRCSSAWFLRGILENGGGNFFDIVSFHGYTQYWGSTVNVEMNPGWIVRGGVVEGKVDFIRQVLSQYGLEKPIIHSEGSLTCPDALGTNPYCSPPGAEFLEAQSDYLVWLYTRNMAIGLDATIWYQFDGEGWRASGMLGHGTTPKPVYNAFKFINQQLSEAAFSKKVYTEIPNLSGYEFTGPGKRIWVIWSNDGTFVYVPLPNGVKSVYDLYGTPVNIVTPILAVKRPVYIELER